MSEDMPHDHLLLGRNGEDVATGFLRQAGFNILDRNWRFGHLELDLVCEKNGQIIFVEVKTRRTSAHGGPAGAITPRKKKNLIKAAQAWLNFQGKWCHPCRFDVLCLIKNGANFSLEHYPNAFDTSPSLGGSHSSWQY